MKTDWLPSSRTEQLAMAKDWNAILADKVSAQCQARILRSVGTATYTIYSGGIKTAQNAVLSGLICGAVTDTIFSHHFFPTTARVRKCFLVKGLLGIKPFNIR